MFHHPVITSEFILESDANLIIKLYSILSQSDRFGLIGIFCDQVGVRDGSSLERR